MVAQKSSKVQVDVQGVFSELKSFVSKAFSAPFELLSDGGATVEWYSVRGSYIQFAFAKTLATYKLNNAGLKELVSMLAKDAHEVYPGLHYDYHRVWGSDRYTHDAWVDVVIDDELNKVYVRLFYITSLFCFESGSPKPLPSARFASSWEPPHYPTKEFYETARMIENFLFGEEPAKRLSDVSLEVFKVDEHGFVIALRGYYGYLEVPAKLYPELATWLEHGNFFDSNNSTTKVLQFATVLEPYENVMEERRLYTKYDPEEEVLRFYGRLFVHFGCPVH